MSINAIDGISSARPANKAYELYAASLAERNQQAPTQEFGSALQQMMAMLMQSLLGAAGQGASNSSSQRGGAGGTQGMGGIGAPSSTGMGGSNPLQGLLSGLQQLLQSLAPLLQALGGDGMKPNEGAADLANKLAGGDGAAGSGMPSGQGAAPAQAPTSAPVPASSAPSSAPSSSSPVDSVKPTEMPPATGTVIVNEPIVIKAGQTFDGGGNLYQAGPSLGDGGQSETQKPVFILENGATLKNLQVAGADGVHVNGDATIKNVWWEDVGEDALTKKGAGDVKVIGGGAYEAHDKIFQVNAGGSLSIEGFTAHNFGRGVAQNGGTTFPLDVSIKNSSFTNGDELFRTDSPNAKITLDNVDLNDVNYDARGPLGMEVFGGQKVGWLS